MDIQATVTQHLDDINNLEEITLKSVEDAMRHLISELYDEVEKNLHGGVLQLRSGKLADSIMQEVTRGTDSIIGRVYSTGTTYAEILEEGGTTSPHSIIPVNSMVLAFGYSGNIATVLAQAVSEMGISRNKIMTGSGGGYTGYAEKAQHPGSKMPAFRFLELALDRIRDKVDPEINDAIQEALIIASAEVEEEGDF